MTSVRSRLDRFDVLGLAGLQIFFIERAFLARVSKWIDVFAFVRAFLAVL